MSRLRCDHCNIPLVGFLIITRRELSYLMRVMTAQPTAQRRERQWRRDENSGSDQTRFVTAASCAVRLAIRYAHLNIRPRGKDICSAMIKIDEEHDVRNNM